MYCWKWTFLPCFNIFLTSNPIDMFLPIFHLPFIISHVQVFVDVRFWGHGSVTIAATYAIFNMKIHLNYGKL